MREGPTPNAVLATMRSLAIDGVTAEAVAAFNAAGIDPILLKGPVIVRWLYADGSPRPYGDSDLLIAQHHERTAEETLTGLGFRPVPGVGRHPDGIAQHHTWSRGAAVVELHITLTGIEAPPADVWACLSADTDTIELRDQRIRTLGLSGRLLHVVLHAAQHGHDASKALTDLARACESHDISDWRPVAALADRLLAVEALSAGLDLVPEGQAVKQLLELRDASDPLVLLRAKSASHEALGFARLAREAPEAQLQHVVRVMLPTPAFLRSWTPLARRGPLWLPAAYAWRYIHLIRTLPKALLSFRRARTAGQRR